MKLVIGLVLVALTNAWARNPYNSRNRYEYEDSNDCPKN